MTCVMGASERINVVCHQLVIEVDSAEEKRQTRDRIRTRVRKQDVQSCNRGMKHRSVTWVERMGITRAAKYVSPGEKERRYCGHNTCKTEIGETRLRRGYEDVPQKDRQNLSGEAPKEGR